MPFPWTLQAHCETLKKDRSFITGVCPPRPKSGILDEAPQMGFRAVIRGPGTCRVNDFLVLIGAADIVNSEPQQYLRHFFPHVHPQSFEVQNVMEDDAAGGIDTEIVIAGRGWPFCPYFCIPSMKRKRDKGFEAAGLVLQSANLKKVIDDILNALQVVVE
jgi:hypothetical protein